jgi:hypothetical protein
VQKKKSENTNKIPVNLNQSRQQHWQTEKPTCQPNPVMLGPLSEVAVEEGKKKEA